MKLYIGLVGEKGGGKETFVQFLKEAAKDKSVAHIRSSDILAETLSMYDLPLTRSNLQHIAIVLDDGFGKGTVTSAVAKQMREHPADIVIFDGVRWHTDAGMIKHFENSYLLYIAAPLNTRFERVRSRKEKAGEEGVSFEQFLKEEQVRTEIEIPDIGKGADTVLNNDGSLQDFKKKVEDWYSSVIK